MITAMQSARHKVAASLMTAREALQSGVTTSICLEQESAQDVHDVLSTLDRLLGDLLPNEKVTRK